MPSTKHSGMRAIWVDKTEADGHTATLREDLDEDVLGDEEAAPERRTAAEIDRTAHSPADEDVRPADRHVSRVLVLHPRGRVREDVPAAAVEADDEEVARGVAGSHAAAEVDVAGEAAGDDDPARWERFDAVHEVVAERRS